MDVLFWQLVGQVVQRDPRTDWSENLSLGFPFELIREHVLAKGLADFSKGCHHPDHGKLTPEERALLYCFVNLKKHFFACLATYEMNRDQIEPLFRAHEMPLIIDVGCGPGTACLALADLLPGRRFEYLGIDSAPAMTGMASRLWDDALAKGLIGPGSKADFRDSWESVSVEGVPAETPVLAIFSYFFASHTLNVNSLRSLADFMRRFARTRKDRSLSAVYANSPSHLANQNYDFFKLLLGLDADATPPTRCKIEYRKKKGGAVANEEFVYQILHISEQ